ncbi:MAG: carbohydrate ABC transporter permease [Clostridiales bacterium]|nr:carbohydrate ABC transporter permease [Clostridiales bacterium]
MHYDTKMYKVFTVFNIIFVTLIGMLCILPMIHILAVAFSGKAAATANLINLWPVNFTADAFVETLTNRNFSHALAISVGRTLLGLAFFLFFTILTAYPLSKSEQDFKGKNIYLWFFVFTMFFSGGLVPTYILMTRLKLINSIFALVLPGALNVWSAILLINFFKGIPKELEESATIDGAGRFMTLLKIFLPLSLPSLATLSLFTMVGHWNSWFDGMIYNTKMENYPLATLLQIIVVQQDFSKITADPHDLADISNRTVKAAQIFIGAVPILLVYPFLQKYFVSGIVVGAVKG